MGAKAWLLLCIIFLQCAYSTVHSLLNIATHRHWDLSVNLTSTSRLLSPLETTNHAEVDMVGESNEETAGQ